jgi:hypothetical protein
MMISCNGNKTYNSRKFAVEVTSWDFPVLLLRLFLIIRTYLHIPCIEEAVRPSGKRLRHYCPASEAE